MNKLKMIPYDFSFDELKLGEMLFEYKEKKVISIISAFIRNNTLVDALTYVGKYFINALKVNPQKLKELLYKYVFVIIYLDSKRNSKDFDKLVANELEVFNDGINFEDLKQLKITHELYKDVYAGKAKAIKQYITTLNKSGYKFANKVETILKLDIPYFSNNLDLSYFVKYPNATKLDLITCEIINHRKVDKFDFALDDIDNFILNLDMPKSGEDTFVRGYITYMGYLVNEIIGKQKFYVDIKNTSIIIATLSKEFNPSKLKFLTKKDDKSNIKVIDYAKVHQFEFIYNNEKFIFTNHGITKA